MSTLDPNIVAHLEWLGFVRPTGLVVSAPALVRAGAILERRDSEGQHLLRKCCAERTFDTNDGPVSYIPDFRVFAQSVLGWSFSSKGYAGTAENPIPSELEIVLPDYGEVLRPDFAVRELDPKEGAIAWQLLVRNLEPGEAFDKIERGASRLEVSPHGRMERLLRQTGVSAGLIFNGRELRLISAPRGESSGWINFHVADMLQTAGRPISTALRLLLSQSRLLSLPRHQRLATLLEDSRKFQNEVSERLSEQVLHALYELLRGFQAAHDASKGELLRASLAENPDEVYRALLTVILRLVFLLYAEERDMVPEDETFLRYYSLAGLYERLREDAALFPDTMDQRYGAWAQLLVLFRLVFDGADTGSMRLPRRHGVLFDPDRFKFLEGRTSASVRQVHERIEPPLVSDGTIYRALEKLLVLDGERISYRALDVEQIGSVYETMMGFRLETAKGRSVAIRANKKRGAPTTLDIESLLAEAPNKRAKFLQDQCQRKVSETVNRALVAARSVDDLHSALQSVIDVAATPDLISKGAMILQPSEERRRSGSHYTPRELTEPIVRTTLEPILSRLRGANGSAPLPEQILELKVCDPAMGSGAFLVESCRQLGDALIESWHAHNQVPGIPADEDEIIFARRIVAQRCLYGVDRNPVAVDLAKVSLWLATLARDHALTFVDHALRHGDSLVGLSREQLEALHWDTSVKFESPLRTRMREQVAKVSELRRRIREAEEAVSDWELRDLWDETQYELGTVKHFGDLVVAAYFEEEKPKSRERKRSEYVGAIISGDAESYRAHLDEAREADPPLVPFHWEIEFPEVFEREKPGFDAIVGNPPFAGKNTLINGNRDGYLDWLKTLHEESHGNADLVSHFFRRAFYLLRQQGCFGLIATNTIGQGDTRSTGLRWICNHGGTIYSAQKRFKWPGQAAVVVSVVNVCRDATSGSFILDGREVPIITAYLFHAGGHNDPAILQANARMSFQGPIALGMGFTFDDQDSSELATPISEMRRLLAANPRNEDCIFPYLGGEEILNHPSHEHRRFIINFGLRELVDVRAQWPELVAIVEAKVKPERERQKDENAKAKWWQFLRPRPELTSTIRGQSRILLHPFLTNHIAFVFAPSNVIAAGPTNVFAISEYPRFVVLQCRIHEVWARFMSSSFKDDLRYTPTDCFETFPFPAGVLEHSIGDLSSKDSDLLITLETAGREYYEFRAAVMNRNNEGLTKTYNRFHDPDERSPDILKLRELHAGMDRVVLEAYGWHDLAQCATCEFLLDYEDDEDDDAPRGKRQKKKPWRYRWPDEFRDEVLARLLILNAERAKAEAIEGAKAADKRRPNNKSGRRKTKARHADPRIGDLFA